jgi:PPOX class probable F420-dependent enzyme
MAAPGPSREPATRPAPEDLALVRRLARADHHWAVVATARRDGSIQATVVTAGVMDHPVTGEPTVAYVARGGTVKLRNLRQRPYSTIVFRAGREWVTVEGRTSLIGPDDPYPGFDPARLPQLLRDVFTAAGGTHDNWEEYDRVMAAERRTAVFIQMDRVYANPNQAR